MEGKQNTTIVIGAGAAGFMAAITAAEIGEKVIILEKSNKTLAKVRISGGGRCNVTHHCAEPKQLVTFYPRGGKELLGAFHRFGQPHVVYWFKQRFVDLKIEADGRMFPITDDSLTIVDCLEITAIKLGVKLNLSTAVLALRPIEDGWEVETNKQTFIANRVIVASGGHPKLDQFKWISQLGINIIPPVPSLFTINLPSSTDLRNLSGVTVQNGIVELKGHKSASQGPILITHWGLSGPAMLKLSAWQARKLADLNYECPVIVNWTGQKPQVIFDYLAKNRKVEALKLLVNVTPPGIPKRLWDYLLKDHDSNLRWGDVSNVILQEIVRRLTTDEYQMQGKTTFVEEFVTSGGISLKEIEFKTMQSKHHPGLHFCGEVLDIDGVTGGFNFQAAWTTGYLAGRNGN